MVLQWYCNVVRKLRCLYSDVDQERAGVNDCFAALGRTPEGKRARWRPETPWRRTVKKERNKAGWKSWNLAKVAAHYRVLVRECDGRRCLLALREQMMMTVMI